MKLYLVIIALAISLPSFSISAKTNSKIKQEIIKQSIRSYSGQCPVTSNGSRCGKRSAWSKPGGYSPICYEREVTHEMISRWKRSN
ncbi:hypothetical protein FA893_03535 [Photobacterium damselae subsp. piscicida]|nr:hypothetical protein CTT35_18295 [Photobacterium damselae]PSW75603.1 hypothetical protein CTT37_18945 [Photobacterium damselae]TFZ47187.1 hypothetical protein E4T25_18220 [Photobacterium damselae subsp. piscicida]TJZ97869.1 hypothetical protein FA893_03535 [Photobacterium damselae subsp. piscicida]GAW46175.1 hypothetical protein PDPJ_2_00425 [Photobacterium damselae subsp. piscicida]